MSLVAKNDGSFISVPAGMHLARCYRLVDKGTQRVEWNGEVKYQQKVMIQFEIHGENENGEPLVTRDGKPLSIAKTYTRTLSENSNLRKDLVTWRKREFTQAEVDNFQLTQLLGVWAMLSVIANESSGKTNIAAINPVPKSIRDAGLPNGVNELKAFDLDNPDMEMFESFSQKLKSNIMASPEWKQYESTLKKTNQESPSFDTTGLDDTPPF